MAAAVSRSKKPFDEFQEGEQALLPDVKKQRCSSPVPSQQTSPVSAVSPSPSDRIASSQAYSLISNGSYDDDDDLDPSLLDFSEGESPDSPFSGTPEDADRLLADDSETDTSDVFLGLSVKEVGGRFAAASSFRFTLLPSVPEAPDVSPEPLPPTGLSVPSSRGLPRSSAPASPGRGSEADVGSQNQTGLTSSPDRLGLQDALSIEAGSFSLKEGDSGSGEVDQEAPQTVGEESPVVSQLRASCEPVDELAGVATDRPSEGQAFVEESEVGGDSSSDSPCETQGASESATEAAIEHPVTAPNEDRVEDPSPEESEKPSPEESEDLSPDDPRRRRIFIPEDLLQSSKEKYVDAVLAHARNSNIIGPVNELHELMRKVASEYHSREPNYRHPTDLTVRNYAQRTNREIQKCSLEKWVNKNQRYYRRFADIPDKFERSPIPSR